MGILASLKASTCALDYAFETQKSAIRTYLVIVEEVGHLEVSVDDPAAVQVLDRLQQLEHDALDLHSERKNKGKPPEQPSVSIKSRMK